MAIFIGRNIEEKTKAWLHEHQIEFIEKPLIDIQLMEPDYAFFYKIKTQKKQWIVTSKWAAKWLQLHHGAIGFQSGDSVCCISELQADIVRKFSDSVFVSKEKNSKSLSELLHCKGGLKIFLKGNRSLEASGLEMLEVEVYHNHLMKPLVEKEFETYLFFSPSGIESFIQAGNIVTDDAKIITIGATTAKKAKTEFENEVIVSEKQTEFGMVKLAYSVLKESELNTI